MKIYFLVRYKKDGHYNIGNIDNNLEISTNKELLRVFMRAEYQKLMEENSMLHVIDSIINDDSIDIVLEDKVVRSWKIIEKNIEIS